MAAISGITHSIAHLQAKDLRPARRRAGGRRVPCPEETSVDTPKDMKPLTVADVDRLVRAAREARDKAVSRPVESRRADGSWHFPLDLNAFIGAMYIIMLRTTGLIDRPGAREDEAQLIRHMIRQANPDGGFRKSPDSPSCMPITRTTVLSLRLALGEIAARHRPESWFARNAAVDASLDSSIRSTIERAEQFMRAGKPEGGWAFQWDHRLMAQVLAARVDPRRYVPLPPLAPMLAPRALVRVSRSPRLRRAAAQLNWWLRRVLPALALLDREAYRRSPIWGVTARGDGPATSALADKIRGEQDRDGLWACNACHTMLCVMALEATGAPPEDPAIERAYACLRRSLARADGGAFCSGMTGDMWDTGHAICSYLETPGNSAMDAEVRPAIELLLNAQAADGGTGWALGALKHVDRDSTGFALRPLLLARRTAEPDLRRRIDDAAGRAVEWLHPRQNRHGGFSSWQNTFVRCRPGSHGWLKQTLFDVAAPDVTARIAESLAGIDHPKAREMARRSLSFFVGTQCKNGAWWSRWWAGYVVGTDSVLRALGTMGLGMSRTVALEGSLQREAQAAALRGIEFLLTHQNEDGGWGETVEADFDIALAGLGESTPLQTAYTVSALLRCGYPPGEGAITRGVAYLLEEMTDDGRWEDEQATFTIYARAYYYAYPFHNYVLPLNALTDYLQATSRCPTNEQDVTTRGH